MTEENHEKTSVRLVGTRIRTRDLPNANLVRYHGATSLGKLLINLFILLHGISATVVILQDKMRIVKITINNLQILCHLDRDKV